jgi:DNA transformation protein
MAVSETYQQFVEEQLGRVVPVRTRRMFGGVGIYSGDLFFALIDDDVLYFKADDENRPDFQAAGMEPFRPLEVERPMQYRSLIQI